MIQRADTVGVFQIESRAQMSMLPRLKPENFYDLVIEVAIVRPGPIQGGMVHPYLRRRQGLEPVVYPSEAVKAVLERTLGIPIFQEQVMQLAMVAAGFTPGEADQLRRAMAAWKKKGGLEPFEARLKQGMEERGYAPEFADRVYRQILGFGDYGFPESHSASFALLVYYSAWMKCHHPGAFLAALLNSQPMGFYSPSQLVQDAQTARRRSEAGRRRVQPVGLHAGRQQRRESGPSWPAHGWGPGRGRGQAHRRKRAPCLGRRARAARGPEPQGPELPRCRGCPAIAGRASQDALTGSLQGLRKKRHSCLHPETTGSNSNPPRKARTSSPTTAVSA